MASAESTRVSEVLSTYLPELSSARIRERLHRKLLREQAGEARDQAEIGGGGLAPPPAYDPARDEEGRFRDYFTWLAGGWAADVPAFVARSPVAAPGNTIVRDFTDTQARVIYGLMLRTLLEELHRRASRGLLGGDTPEERYRSFRRWTNDPAGHAELLTRYPGLFAAARQRVRSAAGYLRHILTAVELNRARLGAVPGVSPDARVVSVVMGEGDAHNGGRSVAQVLFDDGGRVLYKPRPMEAEAGYHAVLDRLNDAMDLNLRTLAVVPCDGGGFVEYVRTEPPEIGAAEYFARIGRLAGILYLLRATDIHYQNVVTCADGPVVVDTETLLTPRRSVPGELPGWRTAVRRLQESVVGIGILPLVMKSHRDDPGMDVGVIGYDLGQRIPYKLLRLRNPGRDDMFVELAELDTSDPSANLAASQAAGIPVRTQRDLVKREFARVLEHARAHADEVAEVVETQLGEARFRYLCSATYFYSQLLRMATHPDAVTDPLVRSAVLNRVVLRTGEAHEIADEEVRQLAAGDVPYFSFDPRSRALMAGERVVLGEAFEEPALDTVRARILGLDRETIERELRLIDFAFVNKLPVDREPTGFTPVPPAARTVRADRADRARMVREAVRIGDALVAEMIDDPEGSRPATWIAPQVATAEQSQWSPGTLGYDLYAGSPGIALVLAGLARETGVAGYADAALRVLLPLEDLIGRGAMDELRVAPGGLGGMAGTVYALATARRLLDAPGGPGAGRLAEELTRRLEPDSDTDHLSGLAGALAVCLALHRHAADGHDRALVEKAARAVAAAEIARLGGGGRVTAYTGYAHGAMGIGPVLIEYGAVFDDPGARDLGAGIVEAVMAAYDPADGDWPREWDGNARSYAWCHGAPGMLLGALTAIRHAPSSIPAPRLARLAELTLARGFGNNPTYCHGDLGSAEIVAIAGREAPGLFDARIVGGLYPRLFTEVVERYEERSDTKYAYSNSLMVGQAGLAWSILRHLDPPAYPSVLSLG